MTVSIRPITDFEADWPALIGLLEAMEAQHAEVLKGEPRVGWQENSHKRMAKQFAKGRTNILFAEEDGVPFATIMGQIVKDPGTIREKVGMISNMYVREGYRGSVFRRLIRQMLDWCYANGADICQCSVLIKNQRAYNLWTRMGYKPYIVTFRDYPDEA